MGIEFTPPDCRSLAIVLKQIWDHHSLAQIFFDSLLSKHSKPFTIQSQALLPGCLPSVSLSNPNPAKCSCCPTYVSPTLQHFDAFPHSVLSAQGALTSSSPIPLTPVSKYQLKWHPLQENLLDIPNWKWSKFPPQTSLYCSFCVWTYFYIFKFPIYFFFSNLIVSSIWFETVFKSSLHSHNLKLFYTL